MPSSLPWQLMPGVVVGGSATTGGDVEGGGLGSGSGASGDAFDWCCSPEVDSVAIGLEAGAPAGAAAPEPACSGLSGEADSGAAEDGFDAG